MSNVSQRLGWDEERSLDAMNFSGANEPIGTPLSVNPVIIVYDNQTDVEVPLLVDGVLWKTFSAGEAILEDLRANSGIAANYTIDLGTQFSTNAAVGTTGFFRISIQFAR
jgi:hypothetical protein